MTTYRPGYCPQWIEKSYASQITLRPLSEGDSLSLVRSVVQRVPLTDAVARVILSRAEGNPFFLEELTRVVEHGELGRGFEVPDTVQGVLMARIDRLPEETRRVLQTASVLGREFSLGLLALFLAGTAGLDAHLRELKRLEFLYERTGRAEPVYVFKHALTQEVAYESLLTSTRKALHARAGQALETLYSERLEEHYEVLAYHYGRSPDADKAFEYLERANQKTAKANAVEGAKTYFDAAMTLLDTLPETEANQRRRITLLLNQLLVFRLLSKLPEYHALLVRHEPMAVRAGDPGQSGVFYARLGYCEYAFGRLDDAILTTSKAARLCETAGNADGAEQAYVIGQWSHASKGSYDEALVLHADVLRTMEQRFQLRWHMWTWCAVSWSYTWLGRWERAEEAGQNALRAGQEFSDDSVASYAAWTTSCAYTSKGDMARAIEHGQLAVQRAVTPFDKSWAPVPLAWAWCRAGDPRRGVAMLAHALPATRAARFAQYTAWHLLWLGERYELAAEHDRAREVLEELLDLDKDWGMRFIRGSAHRILGEIALATNPSQSGPPFAVPHFERSIALLGEIKAENELALAYAGVGRLRKQRGAIAEAHEFLSRALEIFERLGTLIEPDRVRAELAELTR